MRAQLPDKEVFGMPMGKVLEAYTQLLHQWQPDDVPLPEHQEAQAYLQQVGALQQAGTR